MGQRIIAKRAGRCLLAAVLVAQGPFVSAKAQASIQSTTTDTSTSSPSQPPQATPPVGHWATYRVTDGGVSVDAYLAHDSRPKPVVILIHGSGCAPLMTGEADGTMRDTTLFQDLVAPRLERMHFALVEKRGVKPLRFSAGMTHEQKVAAFERAGFGCSAEYIQNVTKSLRVSDIIATVRSLRRESWAREIILAGHSEGTHVATGVLRKMNGSEIAAAGLFASAGPIPFFGGYAARGAGNPDRLREVSDQIQMLQRADDDFMYQGLPARRWKTFWLDSTPIEDVRDSETPLFVAHGSRDGTTLPSDLFALEAIRQQPNRPLRYVVVDQGDHAFEKPDRTSRLAELFDDFTNWSLDANRRTGVAVLK